MSQFQDIQSQRLLQVPFLMCGGPFTKKCSVKNPLLQVPERQNISNNNTQSQQQNTNEDRSRKAYGIIKLYYNTLEQ